MKYSEKWGDSVENAVALALEDLGLTREQVDVTVLEQPSRGFFGIGSRLAKVRVEEKPPEPEKKIEEAVEAPSDKVITHEGDNEICIEVCGVGEEKKPAPRARRIKKERKKPLAKKSFTPAYTNFDFGETKIFSDRPEGLTECEEHPAKAFLEGIAREMEIDVNVKVSAGSGVVFAEITGPDSGTVIGKRGQTLDALQYLTSLVVNKNSEEYIKVLLDAEGYREKREIALEMLAVRLADKARKSGRSVRLEPMNPYERKVIHTVLQRVDGVTTKSEGEEPYRRVIIDPKN